MGKTGIFAATCVVALGAYFSVTPAAEADIDAMKLYMTHCKACHGADGKPTDLGLGLEARDFTDADWQAKVTDEHIIKQINDGTPEKMMPFKTKLNADEIKALVPVVRCFGKKK